MLNSLLLGSKPLEFMAEYPFQDAQDIHYSHQLGKRILTVLPTAYCMNAITGHSPIISKEWVIEPLSISIVQQKCIP